METLKDLTSELISWLDSECPAVAPPLEPYDNSDLSHNFCELLRIRLDEIFRVKQSELSRLKDEGEDNDPIDLEHPDYHNLCRQCGNTFWTKEAMDVICESCKSSINIKPAEQSSDKLTAEEILLKYDIFREVPEGLIFNSRMRSDKLIQAMEAYHSQFVGEKVTDEMIEKWAKKRYEEWLIMANEAHRSHSWEELLIIGAKALRDGKIK
jgi:DNA-directed RNA polymerase subunit RPC12/RpoP